MTDATQEQHHLMMPPPQGRDHGPAKCGALDGTLVLMPANVTCPNCQARAEAERLRVECERYGLPVGLDGLLRHIYGNRDLTVANWKLTAVEATNRRNTAERALADEQAKVARVEAMAEEWLSEFGPASELENVMGQQSVTITTAVRLIRAALAGPEPETTEGGSGE